VIDNVQKPLDSLPGGSIKIPKWEPGKGGGGSAAPETPLGDPVPELEEDAPRFQFKGGNRPEAV